MHDHKTGPSKTITVSSCLSVSCIKGWRSLIMDAVLLSVFFQFTSVSVTLVHQNLRLKTNRAELQQTSRRDAERATAGPLTFLAAIRSCLAFISASRSRPITGMPTWRGACEFFSPLSSTFSSTSSPHCSSAPSCCSSVVSAVVGVTSPPAAPGGSW